MNPRRPTRLVDVAELAGVSVSTASRALTRPDMVRSDTRERVAAAARELEYEPNRFAQRLITGRSNSIAIMVPDLVNPIFALFAKAAQNHARERGSEVMLVDTDGDPARERDILRSVSMWASGIILCAPRRAYPPRPFGKPVVYVNRRARGSNAVLLDQEHIVETQIGHLLGLGHERIAWAALPKNLWSSVPRLRHAQRLAARHDIRILHGIEYGLEGGAEIVDLLDPDVTAVAAASDLQAFGVIMRAQELGMRIPEDLSVVGADDVPAAVYVKPPLTTIRTPKAEVGRVAVDLVLDRAGDDRSDVVETLRGQLVVRKSTAAPSARRRS